MAATLKYNPEYHDDWAWSLAVRGATDQDIADAFGVSRRTILRWQKDHDTFAESIARGKNGANAKVEKALFKRAMGYEYTETTKTIEMDKNGNTKPAKITTVTKSVPADVGAMCFWLKNRAPDEWADRPHGMMEVEDLDETDEEIYGGG